MGKGMTISNSPSIAIDGKEWESGLFIVIGVKKMMFPVSIANWNANIELSGRV